ncbi:MAG: hypothetical protein WD397_13405 [Wenzhouxiangellaceae bacterium]
MPTDPTRRLLEINDVALLVADAGGTLLTSPGQIICGANGRDEMFVGRAASERRRINPRATHDRFWSVLDQTPLSHPAGAARSNADLVWLHLRELLAALERHDLESSWTLMVPAAYDDEQLALLLGITRSLELQVDRLISAPVAAAATAASNMDSLVIDAHWHRFSVDPVGMSGDTYRFDPQSAFDGRGSAGRGLAALFDAWAARVNDAFVAQTRFDPSHDAVIEQRLYNHLPHWLAQMARGEDVVAELDLGEHRYRAELSPETFIATADPFYRVLTDRIGDQIDNRTGHARDTALVLRHRLVALPGLVQRIAETGCEVTCWLDEHDAARSVLELSATPDSGTDGAVPLMLEWNVGEHSPGSPATTPEHATQPAGESRPAPADPPAPSHILVGGRALAIESAGRELSQHWRIEREPDGRAVLVADPAGTASETAMINGRPAGKYSPLESGDQVRIGADDYVLLRVEESG